MTRTWFKTIFFVAGFAFTGCPRSINPGINENAFSPAKSSYWIGKVTTGSLPTQVYLSEAALSCAAVSVDLWDKTIGNQQLLEMGVNAAGKKTYTIGEDAEANYLKGNFNPSATSGTVTVTQVNPSTNIIGSYDIYFDKSHLKGTFDAAFCATGVEP